MIRFVYYLVLFQILARCLENPAPRLKRYIWVMGNPRPTEQNSMASNKNTPPFINISIHRDIDGELVHTTTTMLQLNKSFKITVLVGANLIRLREIKCFKKNAYMYMYVHQPLNFHTLQHYSAEVPLVNNMEPSWECEIYGSSQNYSTFYRLSFHVNFRPLDISLPHSSSPLLNSFLITSAIIAVVVGIGLGVIIVYWHLKARSDEDKHPLTYPNDSSASANPVPQTAEVHKTDTSTNDAVYEYVDYSACRDPVHQTFEAHKTDTSTNDAVYEYVDYSACGNPGLKSSPDIACRLPYPLPPDQEEETQKYIHYDTVYEDRLNRIIMMDQIRRNLRRLREPTSL